jgi:hypothetical protein
VDEEDKEEAFSTIETVNLGYQPKMSINRQGRNDPAYVRGRRYEE